MKTNEKEEIWLKDAISWRARRENIKKSTKEYVKY